MKNTLESTLLAKGWLEDENIWNSVKEWDSTIFNGEGDIELFHEICVDYYKKYKSLPDRFVALSEAKTRLKKTYTDTLFNEIYESDGYKYNDWLKNALAEYKQSSLLKQFAMSMIDDIDKGEYHIEKWIRAIENTNRKEKEQIELTSINEAYTKEHPEMTWIIKDFIPEGITLVAAREKIGKSTLMRQIALSVSTGDSISNFEPEMTGKVLYMDFETPMNKIPIAYSQFDEILSERNGTPLLLADKDDIKRIPEGFERQMCDLLEDEEHKDIKLIIIDTWYHVKTRQKPNGSAGSYEEDAEDMKVLMRLNEKYGVSFFCVTHERKDAKGDNPLDRIHGGIGKAATAENIINIEHIEGNQYLFHVKGRYIEGNQYKAKFEDKLWTFTRDNPYDLNEQEEEIWDLLVEYTNTPLSPKRIQEIKGYNDKEYEKVKKLLVRMANRHKIIKKGTGNQTKYMLPDKTYTQYKNFKEIWME